VKIIAGNFPANHGEIRFEGNAGSFLSSIDARAVGIEVVYQDLALADNLTAAANVFLGRELKWKFGPFAFLDHKAMAARALELFGELRSETRPQHLVKQMSGGQRQAVAIARTRLSNATTEHDDAIAGGPRKASGMRCEISMTATPFP